jgi:hypothetical protein
MFVVIPVTARLLAYACTPTAATLGRMGLSYYAGVKCMCCGVATAEQGLRVSESMCAAVMCVPVAVKLQRPCLLAPSSPAAFSLF